jgi:hypothetical protein
MVPGSMVCQIVSVGTKTKRLYCGVFGAWVAGCVASVEVVMIAGQRALMPVGLAGWLIISIAPALVVGFCVEVGRRIMKYSHRGKECHPVPRQ